MRMKTLVILTVSLFVFYATGGIAKEVEQERARIVAQNWIYHLTRQHGLWISPQIIEEEPVVFKGRVVGYNFILSPQGHILVPSRDELPPVKLYSDTATLRMADNSDMAKWIMEELSSTYDALEAHREELDRTDVSDTENGRLWSLFGTDSFSSFQVQYDSTVGSNGSGSIGPLLSTWWDQGDPYNMDCPLWYTGERTITGCTATAAAQIMKYWNYPATGQGSTSYTWNDGQRDVVLSRDFSQSTYHWDLMKSMYKSPGTSEQRDAVARLNSDVGIAFDMDYGTQGSIGDMFNATTAYPAYFKYKPTLSAIRRSSYASDSAWMGVFKNEILNNRPSLFNILDPIRGGHTVVVDGYSDSPLEQIHINFGWSGSYDGWYVANNIIAGPNNFSDVNSQRAVIGIEPQTASCVSPAMPSNPFPQNNATGVATNPTLSWSACANTTSYNVLLGTSFPPPKVGSTTGTSYSLSGLDKNTLYYWVIVASHDCGSSSYVTSGPLWSFTTSSVSSETVSTAATPSGPSQGVIGKSYKYKTGGSSSSLGHSVEYQFDWKGDGSDLSPWGSVTQSKNWSAAGTNHVRARARCSQDVSVTSNWSDFLSVSISLPDISVTPTAYDFGNVKVKKSKTASLKVANKGAADLLISAPAVTGPDASVFTIAGGGGSKTVKPGRSITVKVAFKPTSTGSKTSTLEITSNDPDTPTIDILLTGTGQ